MKTIKQLKTIKPNYLTARTALNVPNKEMTGDWNFYNYFIATPNEYFVGSIDDNIFGDKGIIEVSQILKKHGVEIQEKIWSADHYRAIADMFLDCMQNKNSFRSLFFAVDDWLNTTNEKKQLFTYLELLNNNKINNWIQNASH